MSDLSGWAASAVVHDDDQGGAEAETSVDWEQDAVLIEQVGSEFDAVEAALRRLDTPSAGRCDVCGTEISRPDLIANPLRVRCDAHQSGPSGLV